MVRMVITLEDNGQLAVQGQLNGGDLPPDLAFAVVTSAWVEVLAWKIRQATGLIVPHN